MNSISETVERSRWHILVLMTIVLMSFAAFSQSKREFEYRFKAVYLLNFLQFVEWPDSTFETGQAPIVVGILGEDPFGRMLDETFQSENIGGHPLVIKRYRSLDEFAPCHALFISSSERENLPAVLKKIQGIPLLALSDIEGFGERGGTITLYLEKNKVRFAINMQALKLANLRVSSKLLRLAKVINQPENVR